MMSKCKVCYQQLNKFYYYAFPMQAVLVTCNDEKGNTNVITIAWHTPISKNPPLDKEAQVLLDRADSPKRKIVDNLDDAKKWIGISEIIIEKD